MRLPCVQNEREQTADVISGAQWQSEAESRVRLSEASLRYTERVEGLEMV
jgi:hypothetical protein